MRLTPWEEERLLIFSAAELARRHRERGLLLNAPEATALICDAMFEAARGGAGYAEVETAGRSAVSAAEVLPGVRELVDIVRLEVLLDDGVRLVVLLDPIGGGEVAAEDDAPGAVRPAEDGARRVATAVEAGGGAAETIEVTVRSESSRVIRVSSHYPFDKVNARLVFDRAAASGFRLDLRAGASERWGPGETRTVRLTRSTRTGGDR